MGKAQPVSRINTSHAQDCRPDLVDKLGSGSWKGRALGPVFTTFVTITHSGASLYSPLSD
jgi:hypothetical protein